MGSLTIRNLDDDIKTKLRISAASKGISMEEEARQRLRSSLNQPATNRKSLTVDELMVFSVKPAVPFDLKKASDELSEEGF
jgi:plasmid stability protein